jgi:hypothetical protein
MIKACTHCGGPFTGKSISGICYRNEECAQKATAAKSTLYKRKRGVKPRGENIAKRYRRRRKSLFDDQNGICKCGENLPNDFVIDHDHSCCSDPSGKKGARNSCGICDRAALCPGCNIAIGMLRESSSRFRKLADWLDSIKDDHDF